MLYSCCPCMCFVLFHSTMEEWFVWMVESKLINHSIINQWINNKFAAIQCKLHCQWKKVPWLMYLLINFCWGSYMWGNNSVPIVMHEPYKSDDISCRNTFGVKKVQPSKVESYLEVNVQIGNNKIWYQIMDKWLSILNTLILHWTHYSQLATVSKV